MATLPPKKQNRYPGVYSYQVKTGTRWACVFEREPAWGDRPRKQGRKSGFRTQDEALAFQRANQYRRNQGEATFEPSRQPLADYLEEWVTTQVSATPRTRRLYRLRFLRVCADIGTVALGAVTSQMIDRSYTKALTDGYNPTTIAGNHLTLKQALKKAVEMELIRVNPCDRVRPPRGAYRKPTTWTREQMQTFLASTCEEPFWGMLWWVAAETWMRIGEYCDLRWSDISLDDKTISVSHALTITEDGKFISGPVKTINSVRVIPVSDELIDALAAFRARSDHADEDDLIFPGQTTGRWMANAVVARALRAACVRAGLPVLTPHEIRHSGGSIAHENDVPINIISERLGHRDISFTMKVYVHSNADQHRRAATKIGELLRPS